MHPKWGHEEQRKTFDRIYVSTFHNLHARWILQCLHIHIRIRNYIVVCRCPLEEVRIDSQPQPESNHQHQYMLTTFESTLSGTRFLRTHDYSVYVKSSFGGSVRWCQLEDCSTSRPQHGCMQFIISMPLKFVSEQIYFWLNHFEKKNFVELQTPNAINWFDHEFTPSDVTKTILIIRLYLCVCSLAFL